MRKFLEFLGLIPPDETTDLADRGKKKRMEKRGKLPNPTKMFSRKSIHSLKVSLSGRPRPFVKISRKGIKEMDCCLCGEGNFDRLMDAIIQLMGLQCKEIHILLVDKVLGEKAKKGKRDVSFQGWHHGTSEKCVIKICRDNLQKPSWMIQMLLHELLHQKQTEDGTLSGRNIWLGEEVPYVYKGVKSYCALPWEKDARFAQFYYMNHMLNFLGLPTRDERKVARFLTKELGESWTI